MTILLLLVVSLVILWWLFHSGIDYYFLFGLSYLLAFVLPVLYSDTPDGTYAFILLICFGVISFGYFIPSVVFGGRYSFKECFKPGVVTSRYFVLGLLASLIIVFGFAWDQGGMRQSIEGAGLRRAGVNFEPTRFGFLNTLLFVPVVFLVASSARAVALKRDLVAWLWTLFFLTLSILSLMQAGGRGNYVIAGGMLCISYGFWIRKKTIAIIAIPLLVAMFCIAAFGKTFNTQLGLGVGWSEAALLAIEGDSEFRISDIIVGNFSYLERSYAAALQSGHRTYFLDMIWGWLNIIPKALLPFEVPPNISYYNTQMILGEFEAIVPPGVIAYGVWGCGFFGAFVSCFFYGLFGGWLDWLIRKSIAVNKDGWAVVVYVCGLSWVFVVSIGDPFVYYKSLFVQIFIVGIWLVSLIKKRFN